MSYISRQQIFRLTLIGFITVLTFASPQNGFAQNLSPYGAHSHIFNEREWIHFPKNFDVMKEGGLGWIRSDFYWIMIEKPEGNWDYSQYDKIVEEAGKRDIQILGLLGYNVPWAKPAYDHPEKWTEYITRTVSRYKGRVNYWEVWNEENESSFWGKKADPAEYTEFLKITAEAIRKANPDAKILFGGTIGIPYQYIEDCLKAGAGQWFDIMNIHPYRNVMNSNFAVMKFRNDIAKLRKLLTQYKAGDYPIWITEMGWSDRQMPESNNIRGFFDASFKILSPNKQVKEVAVFHDPAKCNLCKASNFQIFAKYLPKETQLVPVKIDDIKQLDHDKVPYIIMPPCEGFPLSCFDIFYDYVKSGGTLFFTYGFPCYYHTQVQGDPDVPAREAIPSKFRHNFRLDVHAWWFDNNVPKKTDKVFPDPMFTNIFGSWEENIKTSLFLESKHLKKGDRFVPILLGQTGDFTEPVAGIYRFNSDLKGNIAVYTLNDLYTTCYSSTEEIETCLPQTYLIAISAGIERFFNYQFQAREDTPYELEDHFGLVHKDLSPKPAYVALSVLTKARPAGSVSLSEKIEDKGPLLFSWKRPDGRIGWAIWNPNGPVAGQLKFKGNISEVFDCSGKYISLIPENIELTEKILYIIGPEEIDFISDK